MLQIKSLACARNDMLLFRDISLVLKQGEVLQILGKNGSGKTTLIRTIAGILRPQAGKIELNNMGICYVGHKSGLHPDLTVQQNLAFLRLLENFPETTIVANALKYFSLEDKQHVKCAELSAGQWQRVSLARLFITSAKLWLLDEPTANLDTHALQLLQLLCIKHLQAGGLIVIATHNVLNFSPINTALLQLEEHGT